MPVEADIKRQLKIQKALYEIADAASDVTDMQSFYKKLHKIVGKLMYAENFFIALYDEVSNLVTWPYHVDTVDVEPPQPRLLADHQGATGWVIRHGKTLAVVDGSWAEAVSRGEAQTVGTPSNGIAVPLRAGNKTIGVIMVQSYIDEIGYQLDDVKVLEFVAQHISTALTRARAIEETRQRNTELQIINSIQQGLAAELNFQAIVDLVGDKLREVFRTPDFVIFWYDEKAELLHVLYDYEHGKRLTPAPMKLDRVKALELPIKRRKPLVVNTVAEREKMNLKPAPGTDLGKSIIYVPIISSDRVRGIIGMENYEDVLRALSGFQPDLRSLLEIIAENIAKVCDANDAHIYRVEGKALKEWTHRGPIPGLEAGESLPLPQQANSCQRVGGGLNESGKKELTV